MLVVRRQQWAHWCTLLTVVVGLHGGLHVCTYTNRHWGLQEETGVSADEDASKVLWVVCAHAKPTHPRSHVAALLSTVADSVVVVAAAVLNSNINYSSLALIDQKD